MGMKRCRLNWASISKREKDLHCFGLRPTKESKFMNVLNNILSFQIVLASQMGHFFRLR